VAPEVSGTIREVRAVENAPVKKGDVLMVVAGPTLKIAVEGAEAKLDMALTDLRSQMATRVQRVSMLAATKADYAFASKNLARQQALTARGLLPAAKLEEAEKAAQDSASYIVLLEQEIRRIDVGLGPAAGGNLEAHPSVRAARAALSATRVDFSHLEVIAPRSGIASRVPQVGDHVTAGRPVLAIVDPTDLWIEANFKETDLEYVRAGQPVEVELDTYSHRVWQGKVESISQATGAEFAVLPPQNASGNWVKVVQRVMVRVRIERRADDPPLRAGMSATVKIDTGDRPLRERLFGAR
jgi:membrane fusion protein (multidrug efflux system)